MGGREGGRVSAGRLVERERKGGMFAESGMGVCGLVDGERGGKGEIG